MRIKEESLDRALESASLQTKGLPKRYTDGKDPFWIMAVVLVQKRNLEECYCIYQQNADKYMKLLQDFGTPSPIMSIKSIHPYMYLDEAQFLPSGCIEAKKKFLKNELGEDPMAYEVDEMTESDVNHALLEIAIDKQMRADEENKKINVLNEGSDLDGTRFEDIERQKFEFELSEMRKDGCSKKEIKEFIDEYNASHKQKVDDEPYISEEERIHQEMESKDVEKTPECSIEGEFDEPEIDYDKLHKESDEFKKEQLKVAKRKWKRAYDADAEKREGREFENEFGEDEECETLQLPYQEPVPVKRKPGRPKKSALDYTSSKRDTTKKRGRKKSSTKK